MKTKACTVFFALFVLACNLYSLKLFADKPKEKISSECLIHFDNGRISLLFKAEKNIEYIIAHKNKLTLSAYKSFSYLANLKKLSSGYDLRKYSPVLYKTKKIDAEIKVRTLDPLTFRGKDKSIMLNLKRLGYTISAFKCLRKDTIIKASYLSNRIFLPMSLFLLNKNLKILGLNLYILSPRRLGSPFFNTLFTKRFVAGNKKMLAYKNHLLPCVSKMVEGIDNKVLTLTLLNTSLSRAFIANAILHDKGFGPLSFTKNELVKLRKVEAFLLNRKLYLTSLAVGKSLLKEDIDFLFRIWQSGYYFNGLSWRLLKYKDLLLKAVPEIFALDAINRAVRIKSWIFFKSNGSRLLRAEPAYFGNTYRIMYSLNTDISTYNLMLFSTDAGEPDFKNNTYIHIGERRAVGIKKINPGAICIDYNGFRETNWHLKPYSALASKSALNYIKYILAAFKFTSHEALILNYSLPQQ